MRTLLRMAGLACALLAALATDTRAQTPLALTVTGNQVSAEIDVLGAITADLTIGFENAVGLHPGALDVTVRLVSPLDPALLARLPPDKGGLLGLTRLVTVPVAFPVLVRIDPSASSALTFSGVATVELHTHLLHLDLNLPLMLMSAHDGGPFRDITRTVAVGSYRVGGSSGGFSEFLIVLDLRQINSIINGKYDALEDALDEHAAALPPAVAADLAAKLALSRTRFAANQIVDAIAEIDGFSAAVQAGSGATIPDVWHAHDPAPNVAGILRAGADTLKFSLLRRTGP